jgi:hypothetical protein
MLTFKRDLRIADYAPLMEARKIKGQLKLDL